ncbi:M48 family metalloprotease [Candidatus Berkiella aquae]|uniref:Protease HtpX n=1 Tax=Candidatus Berkiella aquae TaxID=295108 RepID=A0A0Q9YK62_9GAMM|nr:zinc metalloprotease HtpX [Candidatus Berkiella aquae]MCS5710010.1 zinc metalloprotease HtpX [Candidatus Berkiella aquae]
MATSPQSPHLNVTLFLGAVTGLLLIAGKSLGGLTGIQIAFLLAIVLNAIIYWFSETILFKLLEAEPIISDDEPLLHGTVAYLAEKADIPMPKIYRINHKFPNAFATGRNPENAAIVVTTGLLKALQKDELAGVMAHELAHIIHRDTQLATLAAGMGSAVSALANMAQVVVYLGARTPHTQPNWLGKIILNTLAPALALLIQLSLSRTREYVADAKAAELCGNPMWLVNALYKLERAKEHHELTAVEQHPATASLFAINPLHNRQWSMLFATHPPVQERINRLEILA